MISEPRRDKGPNRTGAPVSRRDESEERGKHLARWDRASAVWDDWLLRVLTQPRLWALPPVWRYGIAVALIVAATAVRRALVPWMGTTAPYNFALLAQVVTTVLVGIGPGLLSVLLGDVAAEMFVVGSLPTPVDGATLERLSVTVAIGVLIVWLLHAIRAAAVRSRRSEARFATLAAATFEGIVESEAGRIVDCNVQFAQMVGRTAEELKGTAIADLVAPEDRERVAANVGGNRESVIGHAVLRKDGSRILVEAHGRPVAPGSPRRHTAIRDVTERRQMESALESAARKYSMMFDTMSDGVWIHDLEGRILEVNDAYCRMSGYRRDELVGMPISTLEVNESPEAIARHIRKVLETGGHDRFESRHRRKDGTLFDVDITALHLELEGGRIAVFLRDITDRKRAEEALKWSARRDELLSQTAARLLQSHDPQGVVEELCRTVMAFLECDVFFNFLVDERAGRLHLNACAGIPEEEARNIEWLDYGVSVCGAVARNRERIVAEDIQHGQDSRTALVKSYGVQAYCCHPLMVQDRVIGTLSFGTRARPLFSPEEVEVMKSVTDLVVVAMQRVQMETAQKRAEEALRESQARRQLAEAVEVERRRLFDVLETLPTMVCLLTPDYHVTFANRSFREKFGDANGRHCYEYCYERREPCEFCETYTVLKTGQPHHWEVTTPDGSVIEAHDFPFTDVDGSPLILEMDVDVTERRKSDAELATHREHLEVMVNERTTRLEAVNAELQAEIVERRRAEEASRETHDYLQNLIDYANAPIIVWNSAFQITRFNHAFERLTGRRASDVMGRKLEILFPEATREESMTHIRRTARGERWETLEIPIAHLDGRVHTVLWNSATVFDADGRTPIATIAQGQDITDRKQLEEDLRATAANLADANRLKDEFLGTLSHELRTPLNAIVGWTQMLIHGRVDPTQVRHALEVIDRNAKAQVKLVEDVLDVSRILSGKLRLAMQPVALAESVKAALDAIRPAADAKGVEIATAVSPDVVLVGDPDRLQQICWNLLSNAVKFTPKGGRVDVRVRRVDSRIELWVQDTGVGIAPEFLPHLFERFRQADSSTTRQHGGLGLGLAIVRHLVELHGGAVEAESAGPGRGATFTVTLPIPAVAMPARESGAPVTPGPASAAAETALTLTGVRVLVVDDEADARDLVRHVLSEYGAEVKVAGSVQVGLDAVQQWRPHVILGDIGMPSEDGYELIRRIRALPPEHGGLTPAAALTAYGGAEDRLRALSAGYQQHVAKPAEPDELARLVSALARGPRGH